MFVKICGVTNEEDALLAVAMGADAIGFIFAPSPRQVTARAVAAITPRLPAEVVTVGVFRDALPSQVLDTMNQAGLKAAQLHGRESPSDVAAVAEHVRHVIKGFAGLPGALEHVGQYAVDAILVDGPAPGSGTLFDWRLAEGLPRTRRLIVGGGLNPTNVANAIRRLRPWGVDVASGVESSPGHKDPKKLRQFVQAARAAEPDPYESSLDGPYDWQDEG